MSLETSTLTVVMADGKELPRSALRHFLEQEESVEVVAVADGEAEALRYLRGHKPQVLLYALREGADLPQGILDGLPEASPDTRVLILAPEGDAASARQAFRAGVDGFISEDEPPEVLLSALRAVAEGDTYINPRLASSIARLEEDDTLTGREKEILRLVALGYTNAEIAGELYLSVRTVESHRAHIMDKLDAASRRDLVAYAIERKMIP